jgi:hypothetical protein
LLKSVSKRVLFGTDFSLFYPSRKGTFSKQTLIWVETPTKNGCFHEYPNPLIFLIIPPEGFEKQTVNIGDTFNR